MKRHYIRCVRNERPPAIQTTSKTASVPINCIPRNFVWTANGKTRKTYQETVFMSLQSRQWTFYLPLDHPNVKMFHYKSLNIDRDILWDQFPLKWVQLKHERVPSEDLSQAFLSKSESKIETNYMRRDQQSKSLKSSHLVLVLSTGT